MPYLCITRQINTRTNTLFLPSTDEIHAAAVCRKKVNSTEGQDIKINRAGAISGYFKG